MRLSVSVQYTLKDRPKGYLGLTGEQINYGKDKPIDFHKLVGSIILDILNYYIRFQDTDQINKSLDELRKSLATVQIVEEVNDGERQDQDVSGMA